MNMNWIQRKIYLYNVTFGLYMLDWWERYLFNTLVIVLMWFMLYNGSKYITEFCKRDPAYFDLKLNEISKILDLHFKSKFLSQAFMVRLTIFPNLKDHDDG
ncbi:Protein of unknown function (DUF3317) [Quillaja saponaria]|uniref:Uncharacterized protein n=1 Tax=Quillaja saponaria TaxID=32244 RepID=A0AAD7LM42_QUISA|nr:Protein of unknown function (DUF3317) [Quillaja saponaria]